MYVLYIIKRCDGFCFFTNDAQIFRLLDKINPKAFVLGNTPAVLAISRDQTQTVSASAPATEHSACQGGCSRRKQLFDTELQAASNTNRFRSPLGYIYINIMFPSCYAKSCTDNSGGGKKSSLTKLLFGVFVVYMLHTGWLLYGFIYTKTCDKTRGESCINSYLSVRPRLQVSDRTLIVFTFIHFTTCGYTHFLLCFQSNTLCILEPRIV